VIDLTGDDEPGAAVAAAADTAPAGSRRPAESPAKKPRTA
jgi:hypothetical protein